MNSQLDDLFPCVPNENTLGMLIYQGLVQFGDRIWAENKFGVINYKQADLAACEIAEFLKEAVCTDRKSIQIYNDHSLESSVVLLAAVKAGFVLIDLPKIDGGSMHLLGNATSHNLFDNGVFRIEQQEISFRQAVSIGSNALIFGVPTATGNDTAFYFFPYPKLNGSDTAVAVSHSRAVKQIFCAAKQGELHPYLRVVYAWFNGFRKPIY